jgi:hypothetical protein
LKAHDDQAGFNHDVLYKTLRALACCRMSTYQ